MKKYLNNWLLYKKGFNEKLVYNKENTTSNKKDEKKNANILVL